MRRSLVSKGFLALDVELNSMENTAKSVEQLENECAKLQQQVTELSVKLSWYEEQFRLSQQRRFGSSSEQTHPDQLNIFNEAEVDTKPAQPEPTIEEVTYKRNKQKGHREEQLKGLPVETIFRNVIEWVKLTFPTYRKEMKGIEWGGLYDKFKGDMFNTAKLEQEIQTLMMNDDVSNKKGIYSYVLTRNEKYLIIRAFTESQKRAAYERQKGICKKCENYFELKSMEADHITPWSKGGKTSPDNCQMLCLDCNRRKSGK